MGKDSAECGGVPLPEYMCEGDCHVEYECHGNHIHAHTHGCAKVPADPAGTCIDYAAQWEGMAAMEKECEGRRCVVCPAVQPPTLVQKSRAALAAAGRWLSEDVLSYWCKFWHDCTVG